MEQTLRHGAAGAPRGERNRATMARVGAYMWAAGGLIGLVVLALPHSSDVNVPATWALIGVCAIGATTYGVGGARLPLWTYQVSMVAATLTITAALYFHRGPTPDTYLWVALYAFYFFSRRTACAHLALVGAAYALVLTSESSVDEPAVDWLVNMGELLVAGVIVALLRDRVDGLVARLQTAAVTDPLTGLLNRRGFDDAMATELERARRHARPVALIVGDLDHFKQVNDCFGHFAGDTALERTAQVLEATARRVDTVARMGGEEFAVIVPESSSESAYALAERLRRELQETFAGNMAELTMSFGVASYPRDAATDGALLRSADRALYLAKQLGRNRSVIYGEETAALLADLTARREPA